MNQELLIVVPSIISLVILLVNILYYIFGQPRVSFKQKRREDLVSISEDFITYLSDVVSLTIFDGVPTEIRNYSLKIHLCFKTGTAPRPLSYTMEHIYKMVKRIKNESTNDIVSWKHDLRKITRILRKQLSKYCGVY